VTKTQKVVASLKRDNPGLVVSQGGSHRKLYLDGRLIGILPVSLAKEGLSHNLVAQLRRSGLVVS
jgi:hypothetical protein